MQIKTTLRFHITTLSGHDQNKTKQKQMITHTGKDVGKCEHLLIPGGSANLHSHYRKQCGSCLESWELIDFKIQLYHPWAYTQRMLILLQRFFISNVYLFIIATNQKLPRSPSSDE